MTTATAFALVRVDDRLIHGQVILAWARALRPSRIAIVDDDLASDAAASAQARALIEALAPRDLALWIGSAAQARAALLDDPLHPPERTLVLARSPLQALALYEAGAPYAALNLGCVGAAPGRRRVSAQVSLDEAERIALRTLLDYGVRITIQPIPTAPARAWK